MGDAVAAVGQSSEGPTSEVLAGLVRATGALGEHPDEGDHDDRRDPDEEDEVHGDPATATSLKYGRRLKRRSSDLGDHVKR